jgi:hypothetical protein
MNVFRLFICRFLSPLYRSYLFIFASALGPTQHPIQWIPGALSFGVKQPGREADHSSPSSAEVKECVNLYLHSPNTPSWRGAHLKKHRDNFTSTYCARSRHSSFSIVTGLRAGQPRLESRQGLEVFPFATAFRPALRSTQPPIQWVPGALSSGVKRPGREADHSPLSNVEVNAWGYTSIPPYVFVAWCLVKHRDKFYLLRTALFESSHF